MPTTGDATADLVPAERAPPLARPDDHPRRDIVIYDGDCRICTGQMRRLAAWDTRGKLAFLSLHDPAVAQRYPDLKHDDLMRQMVVIDGAGRRYWGAVAVRHIATHIPRLRWTVPLLYLPGTLPLWHWLYGLVARNRYRFGKTSCDSGTCSLHRH